MAYFEVASPSEEEDNTPPTWSDYGHALTSGLYEGGAALGAGTRYLGEQGTSPDARALAGMGKDIADIFHEWGDEATDAMTPAMRDRLQSTLTSPEFFAHPFSALAAKGTQMLGGIAPIAAAGIVSNLTPAGPFMDAAVAGAAGGALAGGDAADQLYQHTDSLPDAELQKESKYYNQLRQTGMDEASARQELNNEMLRYKPLYSFTLGALGTMLGPVGMALRGGSELEGGLVARALGGAAEGAVGTAMPAAAQEVQRQQESMELGQQKDFNYARLVEGVLEPAVLGGVAGGAVGGVLGRAARERPEPVEEETANEPASAPVPQPVAPAAEPAAKPASPDAVNAERVTGKATSTPASPAETVPVGDDQNKPERSDIEYPKKGAKRGKGKVPEATGVSPEQAVALAQAPQAPDVTQIAEEAVAATPQAPAPAEAAAPPAAPQANPEVDQVMAQAAPRAEEQPVTQQVTPPGPRPRQVLEDLKNKATQLARNAAVEKNIEDMQRAEAGTPEPPKQKPGHRTKAELGQRERNEQAAKQVFDRFAPPDGETNAQRIGRVQEALKAYRELGGVVPGKLKGTVAEGKARSAPITFVREAQDLANAQVKNKNGASATHHNKFTANEFKLRAGDAEDVQASRREEGAMASAPTVKTEGQVERAAAPEGHGAGFEEKNEAPTAVNESRRGPVKLDDGTEVVGGKVRARAASEGRSLSPEERAAYLKQLGINGMARADREFTTEDLLAASHGRPEEKPVGFDTTDFSDHQQAHDFFRNNAARTLTYSQAAGSVRRFFDKVVKGPGKVLLPSLLHRLEPFVHNLPVHVVPDSVLKHMKLDDLNAFYHSGGDFMVIREGHLTENGKDVAHTILHEGVHAAFLKATVARPDLQKAVYRIAKEAMDAGLNPDYYGLRNVDEFIAEALSNTEFQRLLANTPIKSDALRNYIGHTGRSGILGNVRTLWDALVATVSKAFGMEPSGANMSLMHAILRVGGELEHETKLQGGTRALTREEYDLQGAQRDAVYNTPGSPFSENTNDLNPNPSEYRQLRPFNELGLGDQVNGLLRDTGGLLDRVKDVANRPDAKERLKAIGRALITNDQYGEAIKDILPGAAPLFKRMQEQGVLAGQLKKAGDNLVRGLIRAYDKNPQVFKQWSAFVNKQTMLGVDAGSDFGVGRNDHLALSKKNQAALDAGTLKVSDLPPGHWEAYRAYPELRAEYEKIVAAHPELKGLQNDLFDFFKQAQGEMARGHIEDYLRAGGVDDAAERSRRAFDVLNNTPDREALTKEFGETIANHILDARKISGRAGVYAPLMREGDHVVSGTYKVTEPTNGTKVADDTWEFKTREDAEKFAHESGLHYDAKPVYYDLDTGKRTTKIGGLSQAGGPEQRWQVRVQKQHTEFMPSLKEAQARQAELAKSGLFEKDPYIEKKLEWLRRDNEIGAGALHTMLTSLRKTDEYKQASDPQKAEMERALEEASLRTRAGNKIQSRRLPRRRVAGASEDLIKNMKIYNDSQANYRAKLKFRPDIDEQIGELRKYVEANRHQANGALDPNQYDRSVAFNEVEKRARSQDPTEYSGKWTAATRKIMMLSYIDRMVRASHLVLHQTHLPMITVPHIAGRHGLMKSYGAMLKAWKELSGAYGHGLEDVKGSIFDKLYEGTNYLDSAKQMVSKAPDAARASDMFDRLAADYTIHPQSGLEGEKYVPSNEATGVLGRADQVANRIDTIFRHATNATEAINRFAGALAAYRLEYAKLVKSGMDKDKAHEGAITYASKVVKDTQGYYTPTNAAPIFKNKLFRPFLQFKQFPQMMYHLLLSNARKAFNGATREEKLEGARSLFYVLASHALMTGALGGLPLEPLKIAGLVTKGLGITSGDWTDVERAEYDKANELFGKEGADYVMHGVSRKLFGVDLHHRLGLNSFFTFGLPDKMDKKSLSAYALDQIWGAPGGMGEDTLKGINEMMNGDLVKGALDAVPLQALRDVHRAWTGGTENYKYTSPAETVERVLGFTPASEAESGERAHEMKQEAGEYTEARRNLIAKWQKAAPADKSEAWAAIQQWNKQQPNKDAQITLSQLQSAATRKQSGEKKGYNYRGVSLNKQTQFIKARDQQLYGQ